MGALGACARVFLVAVNIFFLIIGLVFFGLGLFVRFGGKVIDGYVENVKKLLEQSASDAGMGTIDLSGFDISAMLRSVSIGLIFFGLFLLIVTILGCCGGCCKIKILLISYVIICVILLCVQIIIVAIMYGTETFHTETQETLKHGIQTSYKGLSGTNAVSMGWNIVMQQVKCCGVNSYRDFTGAVGWTTTYTGYTLQTPLACCKTLPTSTDFTCASTPTDAINYMSTGCYDKLWNETLGNIAIMVGILAPVGIFQLLLIIFGIVIICSKKNNKTKPKA